MQKPEFTIAVAKSGFKGEGSNNPMGELAQKAGFRGLVPKCFDRKDRFLIPREEVTIHVRAITDKTALKTWLMLQREPALLLMGRDVMLEALCSLEEDRTRIPQLRAVVDSPEISSPVPLGIGRCHFEWQIPEKDPQEIPEKDLTAMVLERRIILSKCPAFTRKMLGLLGLTTTNVVESASADVTTGNFYQTFGGVLPIAGLEISSSGTSREDNKLRAITDPAAYPHMFGMSTQNIETDLYVINGSVAHGKTRREMYETCLRIESSAREKRQPSVKWHCMRSEVAKFRDLPAMGKISIAQLDGESEGPDGLVDCNIDVPEGETNYVLCELNRRGGKAVEYSTQPMSSCDDHPVTETVFPRVQAYEPHGFDEGISTLMANQEQHALAQKLRPQKRKRVKQ